MGARKAHIVAFKSMRPLPDNVIQFATDSFPENLMSSPTRCCRPLSGAVSSLTVLSLIVGSGCLMTERREIRTTSLAYLVAPQSRVTASAAAPELLQWLVPAFARRGYAVVDQRNSPNGAVLKFKGPRNSITTVQAGQYEVSAATDTLGSVFYVFVTDDGSARQIRAVGKPVVNNREVCSDSDAGMDPCEPVYAGAEWPGWPHATGKEEAEVIRGIFVELANSGMTMVVLPPTTTEIAESAAANQRTADQSLWAAWASAHRADPCASALGVLTSDSGCTKASCAAPLRFSSVYQGNCNIDPETRTSVHRLRRTWEAEAAAGASPCLLEVSRAANDPSFAATIAPTCAGEGKTEAALRSAVRQSQVATPPGASKP